MAIFSGKIIEAYFANSENNTVEVIYKDGKRAINHYLPVDYNNQDFKDLISEYNTDKIAEATIARNRKYAQQLSDLVDQGIKSKTDVKQRISIEDFVECILKFDPNDTQCKEMLFTIKVEIFETEKVKSSTDKDKKSQLRSAKTPLELLVAYNNFDD
jgi:hypothetical protein